MHHQCHDVFLKDNTQRCTILKVEVILQAPFVRGNNLMLSFGMEPKKYNCGFGSISKPDCDQSRTKSSSRRVIKKVKHLKIKWPASLGKNGEHCTVSSRRVM